MAESGSLSAADVLRAWQHVQEPTYRPPQYVVSPLTVDLWAWCWLRTRLGKDPR